MPASYFVRTGPDRLLATEHTGGAWSRSDQHVAPTVGLLVHEMQRLADAQGYAGWPLSRLTVDMLGVIAVDEVEVRARTLRPGRTIRLDEAVLSQGGRDVAVARGWWLAPYDSTAVAGPGRVVAVRSPDALPVWDMAGLWPGGFIDSIEVRRASQALGRGTAWVRTELDLVDEPVSGLAAWAGLLDVANGIAVRAEPGRWLFPNVDLTLHLHRQPRGPWVGLDTDVSFGDDGTGLTASVVLDESGPVGRLAQSLTVRPGSGLS